MQWKYLLGAYDYIIGRLWVIIRTWKVRHDGWTLCRISYFTQCILFLMEWRAVKVVCVRVNSECAAGNNLPESIILQQLCYQLNPREDRQRAVIGWTWTLFHVLKCSGLVEFSPKNTDCEKWIPILNLQPFSRVLENLWRLQGNKMEFSNAATCFEVVLL